MRRGQSARFVAVLSTLISLSVTWAAQPVSAPVEVTFRGRVLDSRGQPIADVSVALYRPNDDASGGLPRVERVREVTTGLDGAFAFTADGDWGSSGYGSIVARKEGFALGWADWNLLQGRQQSDIVLGEPKELSGIVVDEGDSPVVDAEVGIGAAMGGRRYQQTLTFHVASEFMTVRTDSTGRFVFLNLPAGATCELFARKPGRATICTYDPLTYSGDKYQFSPGQAGIKLTLPVEARIEGKMVEKAGGTPRAGVQVTAQSVQRGLTLFREPAVSAQDGTFSIGALPAGGYTVILVRPTEGTAEWVAEPVRVDVKASETLRDVRVELTRGGFVEIRVKDTAGRLVDQAGVDVRDPAYTQLYGGRTDETGLFRTRLAPGRYEISGAFKQGYMRPQQAEAFAIAEGETKRFEQTLTEFPSAAGVVYDEDGKPLEGVILRVVPGGSSTGERLSDAQGRFHVSWDPQSWSREDMVFYIVARHLQRNLAVAQPLEGPGGGVEVELRSGVVVTGQVLDPDGKGIEGADVAIMLHAARWGSTFMPYRGLKTDAQGRYEVPAIPADQRYTLNLSADGYGQAQAQLDPADVTGERVQVGTCTLALANQTVSGMVVDLDGKPVPNVSVSCSGGFESGQPDRRTRTDAQGKFVLEGVCAGYVQIQAGARIGETYRGGSAQTEGGATGVRITVSEQRLVSRPEPSRLADLRGKPLPDLKKLGIELPTEAEGKMLLVCFWDMNQRPSRHFITQLAGQAAQLAEKGVVVVAVQAATADQNTLAEWVKTAKIPFAIGSIAGDVAKTQLEWGVVSLPHLILTDRKHVVVADGFGFGELDKKIEEASGR